MRAVKREEELTAGHSAQNLSGSPISAYRLQPHSIGELLDTAVDVLRERFLFSVGLAFTFVFLASLAQRKLEAMAVKYGWLDSPNGELAVGLAGVGIAMAAGLIVTAAISRLSYAVLEGRPVRNRELLSVLLRRFLPLCIVTLLTALALIVGLIACILPGCILYWRFLLSGSVVVLEEVGPLAAMQRSTRLTSGLFGLGFATLLLGFLFFMPFHAFAALEDPQLRQDLLEALGIDPFNEGARWVLLFLQSALNSIGAAYQAILTTVFYVETRIRREGFDLFVQLERRKPNAAGNVVVDPQVSQSGSWEGLA